MFRYLLVGILATGGLVGYQLYKAQSSVTPETAKVETAEQVNPLPPLTSKTSPPTTLTQTVERNDPDDLEPVDNEIANAIDQSDPEAPLDVWQQDDSLPPTPVRYTNKGINAQPLTINKQQIARIGVGDTVPMPLPQTSQDYEMDVREVGRHANGDKSLKGHLVGNPDYTVVMTEGESSTFATINTPEGSFLLEANGAQGWVMSQTDLDYMADPNLVDYQIPDIAR